MALTGKAPGSDYGVSIQYRIAGIEITCPATKSSFPNYTPNKLAHNGIKGQKIPLVLFRPEKSIWQ